MRVVHQPIEEDGVGNGGSLMISCQLDGQLAGHHCGTTLARTGRQSCGQDLRQSLPEASMRVGVNMIVPIWHVYRLSG